MERGEEASVRTTSTSGKWMAWFWGMGSQTGPATCGGNIQIHLSQEMHMNVPFLLRRLY